MLQFQRLQQVLLGFPDFRPAGHSPRQFGNRLVDFACRLDLGDHLAVVGGGAEEFRLERDGRRRLQIDRFGEIGQRDLGPLRNSDIGS